MDYQLVVVRGRSSAQALQLVDGGVTTVGRHDDCQLRIKSSQVSRKHCEFFEKKGLLLVKDLGSANGTFVNGEKIDGQRVLQAGDELTIGGIKLRVEKKGEAPAAAASAPGRKPSDTAVAAAEAEAAGAAVAKPAAADFDDEFEIDFDAEPVAAADDDDMGFDLSTDVTGGDAEIDALLNEPVPSIDEPTPVPTPAPPKQPAAPKPEPGPEPETGIGDDAVADFLLDIKFDEDDR